MKRFLAIASVFLFVVCITAKDVTALAWEIWYQVNQEYVAKELCVNKAKPELKCNGKCHLMKQLRKLEEPGNKMAKNNSGSKKNRSSLSKLKTPDWISEKESGLDMTVDFPENTGDSWPELSQKLCSRSTSVFRPPSAA